MNQKLKALRRRIPTTRPRPTKVPFLQEPVAQPLSAQGIYHNLLRAPDGLYAWFELGPQHWWFQSTSDRDAITGSGTLRVAGFAGHRIHVIRDSRPFDYGKWARNLDKATPRPLHTPGAPTFKDYYVGAQLRMDELSAREPVAYLGVRITTSQIAYDDLAEVLGDDENLTGPLVKVRAKLREITDNVAREGFDGAPLTTERMGLLMHSMVGLFAPAPDSLVAGCGDGWRKDEMSDFTSQVSAWAEPLSKTTTVNTLRDGKAYQNHVAVLEVGKMGDQDSAKLNHVPWMTLSDSLDFPCVWSMQMDVAHGKDIARLMEFTRIRAEDRLGHELDHDMTPAPSIVRAIDDARRIEDEVKTGDAETSVRLAGPIYVAVPGKNADDAAQKGATLAARQQLKTRLTLHHGYGQYPRYRSFIPGEPHPANGFTRQLPAYYVPTALPNIASKIGDDEGPYIGMAGHTPVCFDPTYGPRHNDSGLVLVGGGLGSGKTTLVGVIGEGSTRRGHRTRIGDPSGNLWRLCTLPHLREHSVHVELGGAEPGTLNPYWLVPDPPRAMFETTEKHQKALRAAREERKQLVIDSLIGLLHPDFVSASRGRITNSITRAVHRYEGRYASNPWLIVRELEHSGDEIEQEIGATLRDVSTAKGASLIFPEDQDSAYVEGDALPDATLVVVTMRDLEIPKSNDKGMWNNAERLAAPALHLFSRYLMLATYADQEPKSVIVDEAAILAGEAGSVRSFLRRASLESRKTNTMLAIVSQNPGPLLRIDPEIGNLIGAAFWGRTTNTAAAQAVLRLLGIPEGHGYEKVLRGLQKGAGDFIHLDWHGHVGRMVVDIGWRPDLIEVLDSAPHLETRDDEEPEEMPDEAEGLVLV